MAGRRPHFINLALAFLLVALSLPDASSMSDDEIPEWPEVDEDGYFRAYRSGGRWINAWLEGRLGFTNLIKLAFSSDASNIVESELDETLPVRKPYWLKEDPPAAKTDGIRVTWLGHATVLAEIDGDINVLTDPIFSQRASLFQFIGPKRYRPAPCTVQELPRVDAVVISHSHYDHLDLNSVYELGEKYGSDLRWFVPSGLKSWILDNVPNTGDDNVNEMVWWDEKKLKNSTIAFTPANHWSRRGINDQNKVLWGTWTVLGPRSKFFFGGDTAYQEDIFKQIRRKFGSMDFSAIPIGAYAPRWFMRFVHVNPDEAVRIHEDLDSTKSLGIHWGTYKLTREFYLEPKERITTLAKENNLNFVCVDIGNSTELTV